MIELQGVSKSYTQDIKAVDAIDLHVHSGEIFGFLGPNGAGKTTTIKLMTGILTPDSGRIRMNGFDIQQEPLDAKKSFGYIPDDPNIYPRLKAIEYLTFLGDVYRVPSEKRVKRVQDLARLFELEDNLTDRIQSFSHGMRQKLMVIGGLLHEPPLWILDEPMTGLDPLSSFRLKALMREQADGGGTVFFSTHVLEVAERMCDRVAIIDHGQLVFCGSIEQMHQRFQRDASLESMFLELVDQKEKTGDDL